ncbi:CHAT domain-containing protein [Cyanobium sp. ATX-6F1]|uniref:CHAT domain-containing protein n=1 Tax=Cyanobium sp. ATX-6F1 TaxID=3137388 RepID=UPI0039BE444B
MAAPAFGAGWSPLPASAEEGEVIAQGLKGLGVKPLMGAAATTGALLQARGPKVLHLASHGYFSEGASGCDPLLNSGIVLAGADASRLPNKACGGVPSAPGDQAAQAGRSANAAAAADDGYLTAKEASGLQLDGTELVVLSACNTASGTLQSGEGVYGLQRALTVAGARSTLLSLWKVDDAATREFMKRYYELLHKGVGRMEALVQVQEEFRSHPKQKDWGDHKYWAAWQLTGDGGPVPGL